MYIFHSNKSHKNSFLIEDSELKHLKVRRIKLGEKIGVIYQGKLYLCSLSSISRDSATADIIEPLNIEEPPLKITLYQCIPQELKTMDFIIQKSVEIGVSRVVPVISEFSFSNADTLLKRLERWKRIVNESMKQCARPQPLIISEPISIREIEPGDGLNIIFHNGSSSMAIDLIKSELKEAKVVTGPEGGFTEGELKLLFEKGFEPVKLGPYILRTETASIVGCALLLNITLT